MKKLFNARILAAMLLLLLLASLLAVNVSAEEALPETEEESYYEWEISEDETTITNGARTYYATELPIGYHFDSEVCYWFKNSVLDEPYISEEMCSYARDGEYLDLYYGTYSFYATERGLEMLDFFIEGGEYHYARLYANGEVLDIDTGYVQKLDAERAAAERLTVDVRELSVADRYNIQVYDETDSIYCTYGAIYYYEDAYWYINYKELPNNYFDSYGNFSYRGGSVEMSRIGTEAVETVDRFDEESYYRSREHIYEEDDVGGVNNAIIRFYIIYILFAMLLPAFIIVFSLIKARSRGQGSFKYWYIVAGLGGLCLLISTIILLLL